MYLTLFLRQFLHALFNIVYPLPIILWVDFSKAVGHTIQFLSLVIVVYQRINIIIVAILC